MPRRTESTWQEAQALLAAHEALLAAFRRSAEPSVNSYAEPLARGVSSGRAVLDTGREARWPAGLLSGFRQGAREIRHFVAMLPEGERSMATAEIEAAGGVWYRGLISGAAKQVGKIVARGRILGDDEYYAVRQRIDELEGQPEKKAALVELYRLVDEFQIPYTGASSGAAPDAPRRVSLSLDLHYHRFFF